MKTIETHKKDAFKILDILVSSEEKVDHLKKELELFDEKSITKICETFIQLGSVELIKKVRPDKNQVLHSFLKPYLIKMKEIQIDFAKTDHIIEGYEEHFLKTNELGLGSVTKIK